MEKQTEISTDDNISTRATDACADTQALACEERETPCDETDCHYCCGEYCGHEYDSSEGMMCINCGAEYDY